MGLVPLFKKTPHNSLTSSAIWGHSKRSVSMNQEAGSHQTLNLPLPWSWTSSFQDIKNQNKNKPLFMPPSLRYFCLVAWMDQDSMNSVKQCNVGKHKACSWFPPSPYIWIWIAFLNMILIIFLTLQYKNQYKYRIMNFQLFFFFIKHVHSPG